MTDPTTAAFAAALRTRRKQLGLTLEQVAHRIGIDMSAIARVERGERSPSLNTAARYAAAVDSTVAELLDSAQ